MKNRFKNILVLIIIACGFWYIIQYKCLELKGISFKIKGNTFELNQKDKLVNKNNINASTELVLVNSEYGLNKNYEPKELTIPSISFANGVNEEEKHVAGIIIKPLEELVNTAKVEGIILIGNSGYRSYKSQRNTYSNRVKSQGEKLADAYVAKPGFSEHQTGLCIDITNKDRYFVKGTKEADWLAKNCYRFGFIIRYP